MSDYDFGDTTSLIQNSNLKSISNFTCISKILPKLTDIFDSNLSHFNVASYYKQNIEGIAEPNSYFYKLQSCHMGACSPLTLCQHFDSYYKKNKAIRLRNSK